MRVHFHGGPESGCAHDLSLPGDKIRCPPWLDLVLNVDGSSYKVVARNYDLDTADAVFVEDSEVGPT